MSRVVKLCIMFIYKGCYIYMCIIYDNVIPIISPSLIENIYIYDINYEYIHN